MEFEPHPPSPTRVPWVAAYLLSSLFFVPVSAQSRVRRI